MHLYECFFFGFGVFSAILFAPKVISYVISVLIRPCRKNLLRPNDNDWAIVTGSTDGIGLEYARQLAAKGYNLLLLSRTEWKLEKVRKDILEKSSVEIEVHAADFTSMNIYEDIERVINALSGNIAVLVNNVGMMHPIPYEYTDAEDPDLNMNILICNTYSVTKMCEIVLKRMKQQKSGIIINISSAIALTPFPLFSIYGATKQFVSCLSTCLASEYSQYGITIQDVTPNQVITNLSKEVAMGFIAVPAKSYVEYALNTVGKELHTSAHPKHKIFNNFGIFSAFWLPEWLSMMLRHNFVKNLREDALKKMNNNSSSSSNVPTTY